MKISVISICGEADHPLIGQWYKHYSEFGECFIQFGCTKKWVQSNGDTSDTGLIFKDKTEQHNEALSYVDNDTDYVFYFDIDEFLQKKRLDLLFKLLIKVKPETVTFGMNHFWKGGEFIGWGGDGWAYNTPIPRIFKYYPGMKFISHRPPTTSSGINNTVKSPIMVNHYSYVYDLHVKRKLAYYDLIYPGMNYVSNWYENMYKGWTPENREKLEAKYSTHPSCKGATSMKYTGRHEILWQI